MLITFEGPDDAEHEALQALQALIASDEDLAQTFRAMDAAVSFPVAQGEMDIRMPLVPRDTSTAGSGPTAWVFKEDDDPLQTPITPVPEAAPAAPGSSGEIAKSFIEDRAPSSAPQLKWVFKDDAEPLPGSPAPTVASRREEHRGRIAGWTLGVYALFLVAWVVLDVLGLSTDAVQGALVALGILTTAIGGFYFPGKKD